MDFIYFVFALFVFVLMLIVVILNDRLRRSKEAGRGVDIGTEKEKERRLFLLYQNLEDLINGAEEYTEEAREEMHKLKGEMEELLKKCELIQQTVAAQAKQVRMAPKSVADFDLPSVETTIPSQKGAWAYGPHSPIKIIDDAPREAKEKEEAVRCEKSNMEMVYALNEKGYAEENIAQQLSLSRGEVSLILGVQQR